MFHDKMERLKYVSRQFHDQSLKYNTFINSYKSRFDIPAPPRRTMPDPQASQEVDHHNRADSENQVHGDQFDYFLPNDGLPANIRAVVPVRVTLSRGLLPHFYGLIARHGSLDDNIIGFRRACSWK